jgi:putative membrane protein
MHMAGGGLFFGGTKLYEIILLPIVGEPFNIFKYDQLVHAIGFGVATLLVFQLLKPLLKKNDRKWTALSIVVVMAGLGIGALNEILEFAVTIVAPSTGVGGYTNTALDLVFNLLGAIIAMFFIRKKENG